MQTIPRAAIYGHRGARAERPENTMDGFLHAAATGVAGIETDIALSADACPVLHHDPELPDGSADQGCGPGRLTALGADLGSRAHAPARH